MARLRQVVIDEVDAWLNSDALLALLHLHLLHRVRRHCGNRYHLAVRSGREEVLDMRGLLCVDVGQK